MKAKLLWVCGECAREGSAGLGERTAVLTSLASFLSFLAFEGTEGEPICCQMFGCSYGVHQ